MSNPIDLSWRSSWAHSAILEKIAKTLRPTETSPTQDTQMPIGGGGTIPIDSEHIPHFTWGSPRPTDNDSLTVAIVGAGCAGLFVPMVFNELRKILKEKNLPDLPVTCEIFEACPEKRLGGRLYTYQFPQGGSHDYYDVGAMRTLDLFKNELHMPTEENATKTTPAGTLIKYYYQGDDSGDQPVYFNDIQYPKPPKPGQKPVNPYDIPDIPDYMMQAGPGQLLADQISYFTNQLKKNPEQGWKILQNYDKFSTRSFFYQPFTWEAEDGKVHTRPPYDYKTVEWLETFNSGTRWFDQAFSETVLEEAAFDAKADWWCIMGGTQQVARKMLDKVMTDSPNTKINFDSLVTSIGIGAKSATPGLKDDPYITVGGQTKSYNAVFNSVPLGCMRRMDLRKLPLTYGTKQALRSLNYGSSTKVAMRFNNMWWRDQPFNIKGGLAKTDLPLRVCVYPSYNLDDPISGGGVLLCSYCWSQDADRMGALIDNDGSDTEKLEKLKELLIHNLTLLHCKTGLDYDHVRELIVGKDGKNLQEMHAFDWTRNELSTGAFAYFGPGQFKDMLPDLVSTDGRHIVIGEAASAHHAWVVGALESAVRGVYQFVCQRRNKHKGCLAAWQLYNDNAVRSPYGPVPPEYNRSIYDKDLRDKSVDKPVIGEMLMHLSNLEAQRLESEAAAAA